MATKKNKGLLSVAAFARLIGVSVNPVRYAISKGRISIVEIDGRKLLNPKVAQKEWRQNTNQTQSKNSKKKGQKPGPKTNKEKYTVPTFKGLTTADAERQDKVYKARLSELKYLEQAGELLQKSAVEKEAFEIARKVRDSVMSLPARFAHELAAEIDPHKIEVWLNKELASCLEDLAVSK